MHCLRLCSYRLPPMAAMAFAHLGALNCFSQRLTPACVGVRRELQCGSRRRRRLYSVRALYADDDDGLFAPVSKGDGFSFYGGKYSDEKDKTDDWWDRGNFTYAYTGEGAEKKVKDPLFGLKLGQQSQVSETAFRWFYIEEGNVDKPLVLLLHGLGSQAYSFRNIIPLLSTEYRTIAVDWLGFGFSDKPMPGYGFGYTAKEYAAALDSLLATFGTKSVSIVVQGHFAPAVVQFANANPEKVSNLILINPPVAEQHTKLPSALSSFTNVFFGEIFSQDPYKASDGVLAQAGFYSIKEEDKMVYRKPYLSSGSAGFALKTIARVLKEELKESVTAFRETLSSANWKIPTSIISGMNDRWLRSKELEDFAKSRNLKLVQLPEVGHHAQEDSAEGIAEILKKLLRQATPQQ